MKPHAGWYNRHMGLVSFVHSIFDYRHSEHKVPDLCAEASPTLGISLQPCSLYFNLYRNNLLCRKPAEYYPDSLGAFLRDLYNTAVRT